VRDRAGSAGPLRSYSSKGCAGSATVVPPSSWRQRDRALSTLAPVSSAAPVIAISNLTKTYATGLTALHRIDLEIRAGEIFALLGPNGAGKTTLINIVCGIATGTTGRIEVAGHDIEHAYRAARSLIGLVPQELATDSFESVWATVSFSRGLFGSPPDPGHIERVLRDLALWDKRKDRIMTLSGGMKRRVMIAKALAHEPAILFLDEPTAGVDVELRRDMWTLIRRLRAEGATIILTTHYLEEAEELADRIAVLNRGELVVVEEKSALLERFGRKRLTAGLAAPLDALPAALAAWPLELGAGGHELTLTLDLDDEATQVAALLARLRDLGIGVAELRTHQTSLEDVFVALVGQRPGETGQ
jgi:ABC-2 type transport system ATP-binding protein